MFENRLRDLRIARKLTQKQVADALGLKENTYRHYENDEREPSSMTLLNIGRYFGVSLDYLYGYNGKSPEDNPDIAPYKAGQHEEPPPPNAEYMLDNKDREFSRALAGLKHTQQVSEHKRLTEALNAKKPPPEEGGIYPIEMTESELEKFRERLMTLNSEEREDLSTFLDFLDFRRNGGR